MAINVIAERPPADKTGDEIVDDLITSEACARERGRNEIDFNSTSRENVTGTGPLKDPMVPGRIIEVHDTETSLWRGQLMAYSIVIDAGPETFDATAHYEIERLAQ